MSDCSYCMHVSRDTKNEQILISRFPATFILELGALWQLEYSRGQQSDKADLGARNSSFKKDKSL